jgi:hypothetical protein
MNRSSDPDNVVTPVEGTFAGAAVARCCATVATIVIDSGLRSVSTGLFRT